MSPKEDQNVFDFDGTGHDDNEESIHQKTFLTGVVPYPREYTDFQFQPCPDAY
jgi:hypothetical protein